MAAKQHELFQTSLNVTPIGSDGPRLWVRRLVIWKEPGGEIIRDVSLRPGLNIVWTPDNQGIGHGGGKTLFCRLLRYCLGEDRFAPEDQRDRIAATFMNGIVGAEVILDGVCWAIVRPLGNRRRQYAVREAKLDEVANCQESPTGIEPFIAAIEKAILGQDLAAVIPGHRQEHKTWPIALAWLTRDQECRFDHVLDWRSSISDSDSPARGLTQTEKLDALRAFLQAITPEEKLLRAEVFTLDEERRVQEQETSHRNWEIARLRKHLLSALQVAEDAFTDGPAAISILRKEAAEKLAAITGSLMGESDQNLEHAREDYEQATNKVNALERQIALLEAELPAIQKTISLIEGEYPGLYYAYDEAQSYPCPICEVPIDRVLATKCELSHKLPDVNACQKRLKENRNSLEREKERTVAAKTELEQCRPKLALAKQEANTKKSRYVKQESLVRRSSAAWYAAQRLVDEVERLSGLMARSQIAEEAVQKSAKDSEQKREQVLALMGRQAQVFDKLGEKFDSIIRVLVGQDARGEIRLTGKGLSLVVQMGGDRSTSAIDSLKVVAFDLAALCMSLEGSTKVPALLLHDSPREADLGLPLYERLFHLAHWLEENTGSGVPAFQYVVTTTTKPPKALAKKPWLRLTLSGSPAERRLLMTDL